MLRTKQFGTYQIIRKLGRGMTDVYLAFDTAANRHAVLKIVEESPDPMTQLVLQAERRGAALQRQLHDFDPRVIEVYEFGDLDGYFFLAMQYIEGQSIAGILKQEKRLAPERAAKFAAEICSQLDKLHSFLADIDGQRRAVVHGDIKPSNIQIGAADEVRLLDFGIAKAITFTHNLTRHNLGSPSYCSPERLGRGQVDHHADLWAVGVTLYEMTAGSPPYQAQDTRKLENLIQSRRPPRALPHDCPPALKAIIAKALAGDLHQRYVSAAAFESDLRRFLQSLPTVAERQKRVAWNSNATVERSNAEALSAASPAGIATPASPAAETVRPKRSAWWARLEPKLSPARMTATLNVLGALCWGMLAGLVVFIPARYSYLYWRESAPLRGNLEQGRKSAAEIDSDWDLFRRLQRQNRFLGGFSPAARLSAPLRTSYIAAADDVIERYRNSNDPHLENFDWRRAQMFLQRVLELDDRDRASRGKLAVCNGYMNLLDGNAEPAQRRQQRWDGAKRNFAEAVSLAPRLPDPHLGLARIYIYSQKNIGQAIAEFQEAQRLGFQLGPREMEQQADGYRFRATQELAEARKYAAGQRERQERYLRLAERDFERARELYEPIIGFSNVSLNLRQVDDDDRARRQLDRYLKQPARRPRKTALRAHRWQ